MADQPITLGVYLKDIFAVIGHTEEESDKYAQMAVQTILQVSLTYLFMPQQTDKRQEIAQKLSQKTDFNEFYGILKEYFEPEQIDRAIEQATQDVMKDYFATISPKLTKEQAEKLLEIANHMNKDFGQSGE